MATINVYLNEPLRDGMEVKFKAPCDCVAVTGLTLNYPDNDGTTGAKTVTLVDAHGNRLRGVGNLFMEGAYIKVLVDTTNKVAYIQNADTNGYLEGEFAKLRELHVDDGTGCFYRVAGNELEWINPPMVVGTEYRTTNRFAGKPVYTAVVTYEVTSSIRKAVNFVPPAGVVDMVVRWDAWTNTGIVLPYFNTDPSLAGFRDMDVVIYNNNYTGKKSIQCTGSPGETAVAAAETWYIQVWYTKE